MALPICALLCLLHSSICREPRDLGLVEGAICLGQSVFSVCWQLGCACMARHVILIHTKMLIFFSTECIHFCYYLHSHYGSFSTAVTYYKVNVFKFTFSLIKSDRNFITFILFNVKLSSFILWNKGLHREWKVPNTIPCNLNLPHLVLLRSWIIFILIIL